jgi:tRNA threonylcarbamoyladenosine biosynthesis protein TsaB
LANRAAAEGLQKSIVVEVRSRALKLSASMLSLRDLLRSHGSLLLIDSASARIQVGLMRSDGREFWAAANEEAGVAVFTGAEAVLKQAEMKVGDVGAFAFCDGPGSVLGIRTAAVALRTWRVLKSAPCFAYCSLDLVAKFRIHSDNGRDFSVIADARRDTWHRVQVGRDGAVGPLQRVVPGQLSGSLFAPEHFRHWTQAPAGVVQVSYAVREMLHGVNESPLFRDASEPDAFLHEEPVYKTWTPQVHQAPK